MSEFYTVSPMYTCLNSGVPLSQSLANVLKDGVVESCIIKDQTIQGGDFTNSRFRRVIFQNCCLLDCNFSGSELMETRFINCDLTGSNFSGSIWADTISWLSKGFYITGARLTNAVFEDCIFSFEDLANCTAESVEIYKGIL